MCTLRLNGSRTHPFLPTCQLGRSTVRAASTQSRPPPSSPPRPGAPTPPPPRAPPAAGADTVSDGVFSATSDRSRALLPLLSHFKAPIRFAFAYGSGAFSQTSAMAPALASQATRPLLMLDLIFGVTHPPHWHSMNLHHNQHHYSCLAGLGSSTVAWTQEVGAGVYFNPYVQLGGTIVKYGVVSIDRLCKDLTDWDTLYLAGRMQKPIQILRHDSRVSLCQTENLLHALSLAFLLSPWDQVSSFYDLYRRLSQFSYTHDFRTRLKGMEDPHKVEKIVHHQFQAFQAIYQPYIQSKFQPFCSTCTETHFQLDASTETKRQLLMKLPTPFLKKWAGFTSVEALAERKDLRAILMQCLKMTVAFSALTQSVKGIFTAGLLKSFNYAKEKNRKSRGS